MFYPLDSSSGFRKIYLMDRDLSRRWIASVIDYLRNGGQLAKLELLTLIYWGAGCGVRELCFMGLSASYIVGKKNHVKKPSSLVLL